MATQSTPEENMLTLNNQVVTSIAESLMGIGGHLKCMECGHTQPLDEPAMESRLRDGWPKHCGYTMRWITAQELSQQDTRSTKATEGVHKNATKET